MSMSIKQIFFNCIEACKRGDFTYIREHWRFLPSKMRLSIYHKAFKDKKAIYVYNKDDLKMIKEWQSEFIRKLGLTEEQLKDVIQDLDVPKEYKENEHREQIYRSIAVFSRLREYAKLFKDYPYLVKQVKHDYNLLKCNPRRTRARFKHLLYENLGKDLNKLDILDELLLSKEDFTYLHQKEMLDIIYEWKSKNPEAHKIVWDLAHNNPEDNETGASYFKYLDIAYIAASEDSLLKRYVEQELARDESLTLDKVEDGVEERVEETTKQNPEVILKDIFGEPVMPKGEKVEGDTHVGASGSSNFKPNTVEELDKEKINEFIRKAREAGFTCDSYMTTESGTHAVDEDEVFYYLFEKDGNRFIVPVGQVGNSMYRIIDNDVSLEQLRSLMQHKDRDELVADGVLERRYNVRTPDRQTYDYEASLQKLINLAVLASENKDKKRIVRRASKGVALADVKEEVIKAIPPSEIPEVTSYVTQLTGTKFVANLLNKSIADVIEKLPDEEIEEIDVDQIKIAESYIYDNSNAKGDNLDDNR